MHIIEKFLTPEDRYNSYDPHYNIIGVRTRFKSVDELVNDYIIGANIVTNDGDQYYAEQAVGTTPTVDFDGANNRMELQNPASADTPAKTDTYSSVTTPITASRSTIESGYPKVNDGDAINTSADVDVVTWKYTWATTDFDTEGGNDITGGCIHAAGGSPVAGSKLLSHFNFTTAFDKSSTDELKVWLNHQFNGS